MNSHFLVAWDNHPKLRIPVKNSLVELENRHPGYAVATCCVWAACLLLATASAADERPSGEPAVIEPCRRDVGTIVGRVTFVGDVPRSRVADDAGRHRDVLHVDRKSHGLRYTVAYLVFESPPDDQVPARPSEAELKKPVVIDQLEHTFIPHLIAIRSGQTVRFTNSDTANHNVRASSLKAQNEFNIFTGAGGDYRRRFYADRNRPVRLGCDIHAWMSAWVYPFDHPYYAVSDARGNFRIENVPPGAYELVVRQPDGGLSRKSAVNVVAGMVRRVSVEFTPEDLKGL